MEKEIGKRIFYSETAFDNFIKQNFKPIYEGSESIVHENEEDIIKEFLVIRKERDNEMQAQRVLNSLNQDTFVALETFYMLDDCILAGTHKKIKGVELINGIRNTDLDKLGAFVKKVDHDTKLISESGIVIRDALTFNVFINEDGIYFIDTTRFLKCNYSPMTYTFNYKEMMDLIDNDLFYGLPKDEILKPIRKELVDLYNNNQSIDAVLPEIKKEYSRYFDSEINSMNDIFVGLTKKRK